MFKINGKIPTKSGTELAEHNIKNLCKKKDYVIVSQACLAWLKLRNKGTFYDLEKMARENNLNLYFIASNELDNGCKLSLPNETDDKLLKYQCILSCSNKQEALEKILKYSNSYEHNLFKLKRTGFSIPIDSEFDELLNETEQSKRFHHEIMHNKVEVDLISIDLETQLQKDLVAATQYFGVEPSKLKIGEVEDSEKLSVYGYAVDVDGKPQLISQYGFVDLGNDNKKMILVNDDKTW